MQRLELPDRRIALQLAGVLRLAKALDTRNEATRNGTARNQAVGSNAGHNGAAPKLEVSLQNRVLLVETAGYSPLDRSAENVAAARHLLEIAMRIPVIVKPLRTAGTRTV